MLVSMDFLTVRTMLFTPANQPQRFAKAQAVGADGLIIDLENAVAFADKAQARATAIDYLKHYQTQAQFIVALRINSIKTIEGLHDLIALLDSQTVPDALMLPKVESAQEIAIYDELLSALNLPYLVLIETASGLQHAAEIAAASDNVRALIFGGGDLAADLGCELAWEPLLMARSTVVEAAATVGIAALDVPYLKLNDNDADALIAETKRIKALGYTGKLTIHPDHVKAVLDTFMPTPNELSRAKHIVEAYERAGGRACEIDGNMIDLPLYRAAKRIVDLAANLERK